MNTPSYLKYSIIIPSFNRVDELTDLFKSIHKLDFPSERFEVVIADDGSTDSTAEIVKEARRDYGYRLRYFTQQNQGPGAARNLGMDKADGDFFIFIDSDVTLPADWLQQIDHVLTEDKADAFGGPDTYLDSFPPLLKAINYSMTSFITTGGMRGKKGKKLARFYPRSFNMGLSRKLWQQIGGFGSLRHGQDIEFSNRIIRSEAKVVYVNEAKVYHKRRTNLRRFYRQVFNWGVARINLYQIDKNMFEPLHAAPAAATLITFTVIALAPFFQVFRWLLFTGLAGAVLIFIFSMADALRIFRQIRPALYLPIVMPAQIFGYGLGFIYNFIRRIVFKKDTKTGFKKNYYK